MFTLSKKWIGISCFSMILIMSLLFFGMITDTIQVKKKKVIHTIDAPKAIGPYSQAIMFDNMLFISGQLGINPKTGDLPDSVEDQAEQAMKNLKAILEEANMSLKDVVQTHIFLKDIKDYKKVNDIYAKYFEEDFPARAAMQVAALPKDGKIEIEMIACKPPK